MALMASPRCQAMAARASAPTAATASQRMTLAILIRVLRRLFSWGLFCLSGRQCAMRKAGLKLLFGQLHDGCSAAVRRSGFSWCGDVGVRIFRWCVRFFPRVRFFPEKVQDPLQRRIYSPVVGGLHHLYFLLGHNRITRSFLLGRCAGCMQEIQAFAAVFYLKLKRLIRPPSSRLFSYHVDRALVSCTLDRNGEISVAGASCDVDVAAQPPSGLHWRAHPGQRAGILGGDSDRVLVRLVGLHGP